MEIAKKIMQIRKELKLNKVNFGKLVGVSHAAVGQWESGETKELRYDVLKSIEKNTGYRMEWIADGVLPERYGLGFANQSLGEPNVDLSKSSFIVGQLPVISYSQISQWSKKMSLEKVSQWMPWPFEHGEKDFVVQVSGLSMWNSKIGEGYPDGCFIRISPDTEPQNGDDVIACSPDGACTFKQYHKTDDGIYLESINPDWPSRITKAPEGTTIVGVCLDHLIKNKRQK